MEKAKGGEKKETSDESLRVFLGGLPSGMTTQQLEKDFADCGGIRDTFLPLDDKKRCKSFGFITFKDERGVAAALKRNGDTKRYGRPLKIRMAAKRPEPAVGDTVAFDKEASLLQKASQVQDTPVPVESVNPIEESDIARFTSGAKVVDMKILSEMAHAQAMGDHSALESLAREIVKRAKAAQAAVKQQLLEVHKGSASFKVCVEGLEFKDFDIEAFRSYFADRCGKILDLDVPYKPNGIKTLGRCTITFKKKEAFEAALALDGTKPFGRQLIVADAHQVSSNGKDKDKDGKKGRDKNARSKKGDSPDAAENDGEELQTPEKTGKRKGEIGSTSPEHLASRAKMQHESVDGSSVKHRKCDKRKAAEEVADAPSQKKVKKDVR